MKNQIVATVIVAFSIIGSAAAQSSTMQERAAAAHTQRGMPGTVGAMQGMTRGVATSAQDVSLQQEGRSTAGDGAQRLVAAPSPHAYSPGTTGANPGGDMSATGRR